MTRDEALQAANQIVAESITTKDRLVQEVIADHLMRIIAPLEAENRRARVQVPLWKGVASSMVERAKRIKCPFGGNHSIADCRCDPHQLGDTVSTMQDELDRASEHSEIRSQDQVPNGE